MSYTNKTANYELPQWVANDKPTFLSDLNGAFSDIDTQMKANATAASSAQSTADANTSAISGITTDLDGAGGVKARLSAVETAQQGDAGNINTINSLIGNGTPTTTDQTIIGAINEIHAFTGEGPLDTTAQTVTGAINELAAGGNVGALDDLSDVDITTPANGDTLVYDSANSKWVNQAGGSVSGFKTLRATSSATGTLADKMAELYTAFGSLTADEKRESYIVRSDGPIYTISSDVGDFMQLNIATNISFAQLGFLKLADSKVLSLKMETSGNTLSDDSSVTTAYTFALYA